MPRRIKILLFAVLCGCSGLSQLPADGGPAWIEIESEHFVLQTDLAPERARETLIQAERLFMGLLHAGWPTGGVIHMRLNLVVFADRDDFEHFGGGQVDGYFVHEALLEPLVVMPALERFSGSATLAHELTHYISGQSLQNQPSWLAEGLACYYQTARFNGDGEFVIGGVPRDLLAMLREFGRMPVERLMASDTDPRGSRQYYPSAWLVTHYLMSRHQDRFAAYMRALGSGMAHAAAWRAAFGDFDQAALDSKLESYESDGVYDNFVLRGPSSPPVGNSRALGNADVAALRGLLYATCPFCDAHRDQLARTHVARALREQPQHQRAWAVNLVQLSASKQAPELEQAQAFARAHPDAWLPAVLLGVAQLRAGDTPAAMASITRALEVAPHQPHALMLAAVCHTQLGQREQALARAEEASRLQPTNPRLLALRLGVLLALGECEQLDAEVHRLRSMLHDRLADAEREQLERGSARCRR